MDGDSARSRLQAGAASAITPSGNGTKKSSSSASLALPSTSSTTGASSTNPIARTQSACFAVTKTPSAKGLALIKSEMTEKTPPPTDLSWLEALALLHKLEKQLTYEVQNDIQRLKQRMTASKIELVSRKSIRLHQMRVLLNQTRRLAREEESVMGDFTSVKAVIESGPKAPTGIDDDDFSATRAKLITLGGKLTDIRRRQQRLAGQVEELQGAMKELVNMDQLKDMDGYEFNMESFKRESSALPDMPRLTPTLGTSYGLFNHAPYTPESSRPSSRPPSRPSSRMSMDSDREFSTIPENASHRTVKLRVQVDSTDDEDLPSDAYLPQQRRKKQLGPNRGRSRSHLTSESSDAESEDCYQVATFNRMTPAEAKQKAEEDRKKAVEDEERIRKEVDEQLKKEAEEEERQKEEAAQKKKEEDEKKKAAMEARQKAAAEKAAQLEAKKKATEEKKKAEADAKRKEEQEKKKAENESKRKKEDEAKKKKEEAEEKKKADAEAKKAEVEAKRKAAAEKKKAEEEAERKQKEEEETKKKQAEEEAKRKKEEQWAKKKQNEADAIAQKKEEEAAQQRKQQEERNQIEAEKKAAEDRLKDEAIAAEEAKLKKEAAETKKQAESARAKKEAMEEKRKVEQEIEVENQKKKKELEAKMKAEDNERKHSELAAKLQAEELERKPSTVSRERNISTSASGRASKAEEEEEMLFDEKQQITSKEDLFSAISDTSLKSGKKMRQRRKLKAEEEYEDSEEEVPAKKQSYKSRTASRDRAPEVQSVREDVEMVSRTSGKSRTTSGERGRLDEPESMDTSIGQNKSRPTSRANAAKSPVLPLEEIIEQPKTVESRTVSRERPKAMEIADDPMDLREAIQKASAPQRKPSGDTAQAKRSGFKSRTSSRETKDTDAYTTTSEEGFPVNNSLSRQASGDTLDRPGQRVSRPPSRMSDMASENIDQLTWEDDDDEESMPSLAPMPGLHGAKSRTSSRDGLHSAKSRTNSRERPASKDSTRPASRNIPDLEPHSSIIDSMPRPGSRTLAQEEEIMRLVGEQEKSRSRASSKSGGSRTSSRERPTTLDIPSAMEQAAGTKRTRTTSRERPKDLFPDFDEENIESEQQKLSARGAKARTQSRERPPGAGVGRQGSFGEADERTGARGRQRVAPMWPEDSSDSEYNQQNRTRSRTASADRKRLVGGGRDDLLAEDQGYDALPPGPSPGGYRTYRDEMELDTQQYADQYAAVETALPDDASFHDAADRFDDEEDEPPPTEPIFQRSVAQEQYFQSQEADPLSQSLSSASGFSRESISMLDARSRTASRDKLRQDQASIGSGRSREKLDQQQASYDYLLPDQEAPAQGARSRTSSRDSRRYGYVSPEEEQMPLRSRTASREGRQTFLSPEESGPIRSRTSSREERYKMALEDRYIMVDDQYEHVPDGQANVLDYPQYRYEERQFASEYEHEDDRDVASKSNKKVSFAEADQKFHLRPEPEVKVIPGTKLFTFSPSATHEQPPKDPLFAPEHLPVPKLETVPMPTEDPTSPQNFLKAMAKGVKGQPKPKEEKSGSIIDSLLRRGKSSSNQGSRNSSRQSSLDRAFSKQEGGSSRSDYSMGSGEYEDALSETASVSSLFKRKKKPKQVKEVDFDQLFARGHAMSEQMETQTQVVGQRQNGFNKPPEVSVTVSPVPAAATVANATPFEVFSKEEAFKQSQKGSGIGYAEKVQSYLTDQQTNMTQHPFQGTGQPEAKSQKFYDEPDTAAKPKQQQPQQQQQQQPQQQQNNFLSPVPPVPPPRKNATPRASPRRKGSSPRRNPHADPNAGLAMEAEEIREPTEEEIRVQRRNYSVMEASKSSMHDREQTTKAIPQWATDKGSKSPDPQQMTGQGPANIRAKRQMTPQEFLSKIQEFVAKAEMDAQYSQPVWPAIASQSQLPPTRPLQHTQSLPRGSSFTRPQVRSEQTATQSLQRQVSTPALDQSTQRYSTVSVPPLEHLDQSTPKHSIVSVPPLEHLDQSTPKYSIVSVPPLELLEPPMSQKSTRVVDKAPVEITIQTTPQSEEERLLVPERNLPHSGYGPKPREHSPFRPAGDAGFLDSAVGKPISKMGQPEETRDHIKMLPSSGKSYLDKPSTSPDPFGARVEMDIPPSPSDAVEAVQSILGSLRESIRNTVTGTAAQSYPGPYQQDVLPPPTRQAGVSPTRPGAITPNRQETYQRGRASLPGRQNEPMQGVSPTRQETYPRAGRGVSPNQQESFPGVRSISPGYQQPQQVPPIGRGRSPNRNRVDRSPRNSISMISDETRAVLSVARGSFSMPSPDPQDIQPADSHIPMQLKPDPLVGHEGTRSRKISFTSTDYNPSIEETDLYRKLQLGLDNLMQTEKFKEMAAKAEMNVDPQSYSQHLGRAEFGTLRKRNSSLSSNPVMDRIEAGIKPRDASNERPASAMAKIGGGGSGTTRRSAYSSQPSRDSSLGRHDSRLSSNSNLPDLETPADFGFSQPRSISRDNNNAASASTSAVNAALAKPTKNDQNPQQTPSHHLSDHAISIAPHPEVIEKKKEVLQDLAAQQQAVKEAKAGVQVALLNMLGLAILVYLQVES